MRVKRASVFPTPAREPTLLIEGPKGALMQTSFACARDFASLHPARGRSCPSGPDQPVRRLDAGNVSPFHHHKGADPLPLTHSQPCAGWMRGRASAPCTSAGACCPCDSRIRRKHGGDR